MRIKFSWDPAKNRSNLRDHGIGFEAVERFEWDSAAIEVDDREDYGELREIAFGFIGDVLHALVFTRDDDEDDVVIRLISLRKMTTKENKWYAQRTR